MWFDGWDTIFDIAVGAVYFYVVMVALVRVQGKRTTSQLNNFDWIVTVAVGSLAASGILLPDITLLEATVAIAVLSSCQWVLTWFVSRYSIVARIVRAEPRLLLHEGEFLEDALCDERITREEVHSKLRESGLARAEDAKWVVLETDGALSVIPRGDSDFPFDDAALVSSIAEGRRPPDVK